jgi:hypothetical protein
MVSLNCLAGPVERAPERPHFVCMLVEFLQQSFEPLQLRTQDGLR